MNNISSISYFISFLILFNFSCQHDEEELEIVDPFIENPIKLPNIDLSNWKLQLPFEPYSVRPPQILNYATNELLKPYMYNDSIEGALVFYTKPGKTTANTIYSRTELREQIVAGSDKYNWTFESGGSIKGSLKLDNISNDSNGRPHRTIVMQIHGRLTDEQKELINQKDNNAPPIMKVVWQDGYVSLHSKKLKNPNAVIPEILYTDSWIHNSYTFPQKVGNEIFTIEIKAKKGLMEVILNETFSKVYSGNDIEKWGVFENYFKAGNYLMTTDNNAFAYVKYYELNVEH